MQVYNVEWHLKILRNEREIVIWKCDKKALQKIECEWTRIKLVWCVWKIMKNQVRKLKWLDVRLNKIDLNQQIIWMKNENEWEKSTHKKTSRATKFKLDNWND